jgi:hypothetical protein
MRIKEGVARGLCGSCTYGWVRQDQRGEVVVKCTYASQTVETVVRPIVECNVYSQTGRMTDYEADKLGWVLEMRPGKKVGFAPPKKD